MSHDNIVVVGVDGSESSQTALRWSLEQARARKARLHLVCAYELPTYAAHTMQVSPREERGFLYEAAQSMIKEVADSVTGKGVEVTWSLEFGDPTEVLVDLSKRVALVVVGGRTSKGGRLADRLLRTVSSAVPANAYCPTAVIPNVDLDRVLPVKHIVVGVDGSDHAKTALQRAVWEADRWKARLSVVASVNTAAATWVPTDSFHQDYLDDVAAAIRDQLAEVDEGRDIDVQVHTIEGNPAQLLTEFSNQVDMLIIGTRGRGGFAGLLLGSTSQNVLTQTACPTMVVPRRVRPGDDVGPEPVQVVDE